MRILNAEPTQYSQEARRILTSLGQLVEQSLSQGDLCQWVPAFDVLIVRLGLRIDRAVIEAGVWLRVLVTATTGLEHIDMALAEARGIAVLSLKGETEFLRSIHATAEYTWAMLLALMRRIPEAEASVRQGHWDRDAFRGRELCGRRLGIVGLGRVGEQVAHYGLAFGMDVAAFSPSRSTTWPDKVQRCRDLESLLRRSDVLTLHVPLESSTHGLIGQRELALLPQNAVLVNTSRGGIIEDAALIEALLSGRLAGAALDVIEEEFDPDSRTRSALLAFAREHPRLLITPHLGGATMESMARTEVFMAQKLRRWCEEHRLIGAEV